MEKQLFQTQSQIVKIETLSDGGLKLSVYTSRELPATEIALLFSLRNKEGWFLFKETEIIEQDLKLPEVKTNIKQKSPSQRLRAVIYRLWETTDRNMLFQTYYELWIEKFINHIKEKLD